MSRMNWGDRMPSTYLETFKPTVGIQQRIAVLSLDALVAVECHWVDTPKGTKGFYECIHGACCSLGQVSQYYALPIWVYLNPPNPQTGNPGSPDGIVKVLRMPKGLYDILIQVSNMADLVSTDLYAIAQQSGKGIKTQFFPDMHTSLLTKEQRAAIVADLGDVATVIENTLMRKATVADWAEIMAEMSGSGVGGFAPPAGFVIPGNPATMFPAQQQLPPAQQQFQQPQQQFQQPQQQFQQPQQQFQQPQQPAAPRATHTTQGTAPHATHSLGQANTAFGKAQTSAPAGFAAPMGSPVPQQPRGNVVAPHPPVQQAQGFQPYSPPAQPVHAEPLLDVMSHEEMDNILGQ
jgi:hypothetical protein